MVRSSDANAHEVVFETATIGGTFHAMHIGHRRYIEIAFGAAHWVYLHVTTDDLAASLKTYHVKPFATRTSQIKHFLDEMGWLHRAEIRALGSSEQLAQFCTTADLSLSVVEPAYFQQFQQFNVQRRTAGLDEFCILLKPRTRIGSGQDLSSHGIEGAEID